MYRVIKRSNEDYCKIKRPANASTTIDAATENIPYLLPLSDYNNRSEERSKNDYYWQLRAQQTDNLDDIIYFANSPEYYDRYYVAQNPNTPDDVLEKLMNDPEANIRETAELQLRTKQETGKPYWGNGKISPAFDYRYYVSKDNGKMVSEVPKSAFETYESDHVVDDDEETNLYDTDEFLNIESEVIDELGLYVDFSAVRGDQGTIWIFSDPNHENNADMWIGDLDEALVRLDFSDYLADLDSEVFSYPEEQWKEKYRDYLLSLIQ